MLAKPKREKLKNVMKKKTGSNLYTYIYKNSNRTAQYSKAFIRAQGVSKN